MNRFQKLLALSLHQWYLLISAMFLLPVTRLSLNVTGFKTTYNRIVSPYINTPASALNDTDIDEAKNIARMINIAATYGLYHANCLTKSLLLLQILKKINIPCQLMIGTKEQGAININNFEAHAWVESEGTVLNDQDDVATRFNAFPMPSGLLK